MYSQNPKILLNPFSLKYPHMALAKTWSPVSQSLHSDDPPLCVVTRDLFLWHFLHSVDRGVDFHEVVRLIPGCKCRHGQGSR